MAKAVQAAAAAFLADRAAPPALALQDTAQQDEFLFAAVAARVKAEEDAREEATARRAAEQARTVAELAQLESSAEGAQLRASGERRAAAASASATALLETAASQVASLEEELAQAKQDKEQSAQVTLEAAAAAARVAAAARSVEAVQQAAGADVVAEGLRLEAAAASLNERNRQLAREAAVTQQESSEAYLRCYQRCQAQVSAAKAAEIESRKAEVEAAERLTEALASATSKRQVFEVERRRQLQAAGEASEELQIQVQATKAADAAAALSSRVAARCVRERALAKAWRSWVEQRTEAVRLAVASARLRRPVLFTAWRAICAEVQKERGRKAAEQTEALFPSLMAGLTEVRRETEKALLTAGVWS